MRLLGRAGIYYSEGPRNMVIDSEQFTFNGSQYDMMVIVGSIRQWGPPYHMEVITEEKREEIIANIRKDLSTYKIWFERDICPPAMVRDYGTMDIFAINKTETFVFTFEHVSPGHRQGVSLDTEGYFIVNRKKIKSSLSIWRDLVPDTFEFTVRGNGTLSVANIWDKGDGRIQMFQRHSGMKVQNTPKGKRYFCNGGDPDMNFDDLVFRLELVSL